MNLLNSFVPNAYIDDIADAVKTKAKSAGVECVVNYDSDTSILEVILPLRPGNIKMIRISPAEIDGQKYLLYEEGSLIISEGEAHFEKASEIKIKSKELVPVIKALTLNEIAFSAPK